MIKDALNKVVLDHRISHMPSAKELNKDGLHGLSCAIPRNGGYEYWRNLLTLDTKPSGTTTGKAVEKHAFSVLEKLGFSVERMPFKHGFDILVNGKIKVDVKGSRYNQKQKSYVYVVRNLFHDRHD